MLCSGLRTNVRRAYAEFQASFIEDHSELNTCTASYANLHSSPCVFSVGSNMEEVGVWPVLLSCYHTREKEIWSSWLEHQGVYTYNYLIG